jgi:pimeloyl-ACP methyl ester carboxylesterase
MKDSAFRPHQLARWREALPQATVVPLAAAGHWPHEEDPDSVLAALRRLLDGGRRQSLSQAYAASTAS